MSPDLTVPRGKRQTQMSASLPGETGEGIRRQTDRESFEIEVIEVKSYKGMFV